MGFKIVCDCGSENVSILYFNNMWTYGEKWKCNICGQEEVYHEDYKED